jgi:hypothetical protein
MRIAFVPFLLQTFESDDSAGASLQSRNHEVVVISLPDAETLRQRCRSLGLPYVHVSNALYLDYSGYTPLYVYDWPHETTPAALARNRKGMAHFVRMLKQANAIADKQTGVVTSLDKLTTEHIRFL